MEGNGGTRVPELTREQRLAYLESAMAARAERARVKAALKRGEMGVAEAMSVPAVARMRVRDLIASMPGYGPRRAEDLMDRLGIAMSRRVRGLGFRQRAALEEELS